MGSTSVCGSDLGNKKPAHFREELRKILRSQYLNLEPDEFEQMPKDTRVLVIDDVQYLGDTRSGRRQAIEFLKGEFGKVIAVGPDFFCLQELTGEAREESGLWEFDHFVILGFGELLREEFVRRWLTLGCQRAEDVSAANARVRDTCAVVNQVVRQHLIPSYPLFLIVILQQAGLGQPLMQGGSYGHLFHAIVTALLSESRYDKLSIKDKYTYLSALAFELYVQQRASLDERQFREWHNSYWREIGVDVPLDRLLQDLVELSMLRSEAGAVSFRYKYSYCFFVAYYLSENLHDPIVQAMVSPLFNKLYHVESSEIVLFLAHLSNDPIIMKEMIRTAEGLLSDAPMADLEKDVQPVNRLGQSVPQLILPSGDAEERRRKLLEEQDEKGKLRDPAASEGSQLTPLPDQNSDAATRQYLHVHATFKTIQILGQALKNNAGSMKLTDKQRVVERVFGLARRLLGLYFSVFNAELPALAEDLAEAIREVHPEVRDPDLIRQVGTHLFGMSEMVGFVICRHVSVSVGIELLDTAVSQVLAADPALPNRVFGLSIDLDRPDRFPKDSAIAMYREMVRNQYVQTLVRILVRHHLYLYNVRYDIRQSVCDQMQIALTKGTYDQGRKMLKERNPGPRH